MAEYRGASGRRYQTPDIVLNSGGEGAIYDIIGDPDHVAKIYKQDKRKKELEDKLAVMVSVQPDPADQYAWPMDVIYENGRFAGYVMLKVKDNKKLRDIYVYNNRKGKRWSLFIGIAKNLSVAVYNVHRIQQVIGDLNPDNILVDPDGMVTLIDTDSYHISDGRRTYRCGVAMAEFVPPELQGVDFAKDPLPTFTVESDRFALAVLIFQLLMNGAHPFACRVIGGSSSKFQPIDNMKNGRCAFFEDTRPADMEIPRYAPDMGALPEDIQRLFRRAFVDGLSKPSLRPSAEEWYNALDKLESELVTCSRNLGHEYYRGAGRCTWCDVERKMGIISQSAYNGAGMSGQGQANAPKQGNANGQGTSAAGNSTKTWAVLGIIALLLLIFKGCSSGTASDKKNESGTSDTGNTAQEQTVESTTAEPLAVLDIAQIEPLSLDIPEYADLEYFADPAEGLYSEGNISEEGEKDRYTFTAPRTGAYRIEMSGMASGFYVGVYVYDSNGSTVDYAVRVPNGSGITVSLEADREYTVIIKYKTGTGDYTVTVWQPKAMMDVSQYTAVRDAIEYDEQENDYYYTPVATGRHRFYVSEINAGIEVTIGVYDAEGYRIDRDTRLSRGEGVTVDLEAGQTYTIAVSQSSGLGEYTLGIGPQQPTVDITGYTKISDCIKFKNQINEYRFTAKEDGDYWFNITQINNGVALSLYLYDAAGYEVEYNKNIGRGEGLTVTLEAGQEYRLQVIQYSEYGKYSLAFGAQKEAVDIGGYDQVKDSIQYTGQTNKYTITPGDSGHYIFKLAETAKNLEVGMAVYDDADYCLDSDSEMSKGYYVSADLEAGRTYCIEVIGSDSRGTYTISVEK